MFRGTVIAMTSSTVDGSAEPTSLAAPGLVSPTQTPLRILFVEDSTDEVDLALGQLRDGGFEPAYERVDTDRNFRLALLRDSWDVVLCATPLPGFDARRAIELLRESGRDLGIVLLVRSADEEGLVEAARWGADDLVLKNRLDRLPVVVEHHLRQTAERWARREVELALERRDRILKTLGSVADRLCRTEKWEEGLHEVLARLGHAAGVDRISVFEADFRPEGEVIAMLRAEWNAPDTVPRIHDPKMRALPLIATGFGEWVETLARGEPISRRAVDLPLQQRRFLEQYDVGSLAAVPIAFNGEWWGGITIHARDANRTWPDAELAALRTVADTLGNAMALERARAELAEAYDLTIEGWARALAMRDHQSPGHGRRVAELSVRVAREMGLAEDEILHVRRGALLHDIGKLSVPDAILLKKGPLSESEWEVMKLHPVFAYELLSGIPYLAPALDIPYYHHERWDGTGYPRQLQGEEIPIAARIFAVVDVWDAMRSDRSYRQALSASFVRAYIRGAAGSMFDPRVVEAFDRVMDRV
jgi:HD-GYP domain-containing protein (c-di-GMP phosphodiesterase class II)/CheY-like chemotaxis protein